MKQLFTFIFCIKFLCLTVNAQENKAVVDSLYLEDQLYVSAGYTFMLNKPSKMKQSGFSGEISTGFIKDIPLNKKRNLGIGIGLGYAYNIYNNNLKLLTVGKDSNFTIVDNYRKNRIYTHRIEAPFEIRWRGSTATKYSFFRVYGGVKVSYLLHSKSSFSNENSSFTTNDVPIEKLQYGLHLAIGYGTLNLYTYYSLQPLFKNSTLAGNKVDISRLTIGLKFYIL